MKFFEFIKKLITPYDQLVSRQSFNQSDLEYIKGKWGEIEVLVRSGRPSGFKTAVLEADTLLDYVLKGLGYKGQTMGDRMKSIPRDQFERRFFDDMWSAHKIRNEMVHNMD